MSRTGTRAEESKDKREEKALELALSRLEQAFGKGAVMRLGQSAAHADINTITTGSIGLDIALGHGGLPKGRVVEISGAARSGKSTLGLHIIAEVQREGGAAAFVDAEHEFDPLYARNIGVDLDSLVIAEPDDGEQALEMADTLAASGGVSLVVVDSLAVVDDSETIDTGSPIDLHRKHISQSLRKLSASCARSNCLVVLINQPRGFGLPRLRMPRTLIGDDVLRACASVRLELERVRPIRSGGKESGCRTRARIIKDKRLSDTADAEFDILYGSGISRNRELVELGLGAGVLTRRAGAYYYDDTQLGKNFDSVCRLLDRNSDIANDIERSVRAWRMRSLAGKLSDRSRFTPLPSDSRQFFNPTQRILTLTAIVAGLGLLLLGAIWQTAGAFLSGALAAGGVSLVVGALLYAVFVLPIAASRQAYQFTLDHLPVGFYTAARDGTFNYVNKTLAGMLGYDEEKLLSGSIKLGDILSDDVGNQINLARLLSDPDQATRAFLNLHSGEKIAVEVAQNELDLTDDEEHSIQSVVRPLSSEAEWHAQLDAGSSRFHNLFTSAPIGMVVVDQRSMIINRNDTFDDMIGGDVSPDGRMLQEFFLNQDRSRIDSLLNSARRGESVATPVDARLTGDGEKHVELLASAVQKTHGEMTIVVFIVDVTEHRRLEHQFSQAQRMQAVGQLAGGIAHDFNNLLTAISGFSELLLQRHRDEDDPSNSEVRQIRESAERAANLVAQLLAFSRQQTLKPQIIDAGEVAKNIEELLSRLLGENIRLDIHSADDLWPIMADSGRLKQVLINLAVNARDAMPEGGLVSVQVINVPKRRLANFGYSAIAEDDYVLIEMTDSGSGIPEEHLNAVFEPFFTTKDDKEAIGLGLSMVYGIVKQSGGYIFADNQRDGGAIFRIFLPRHVATQDAPGREPAKEPESKAQKPPLLDTDATPPAKGTVLLVEDEDAVRMFAAEAIRKKGYDVIEAGNGLEALQLLESHDDVIDLIITDVVMPNMDGPELVERVRSREDEDAVKIIFMSGYSKDTYEGKIDTETVNFLPKPFSLAELTAAVSDMMEKDRP